MFSFGRKARKTSTQLPQQDNEDEIVDGFVLLESENEKQNTVKPGDIRNQDMPPIYNDLNNQSSSGVDEQLNRSPTNERVQTPIPPLDNSQATNTTSSIEIRATDNYTLACGDVPFQFSSSIKSSLFHKGLTQNSGFQLPNMMENMTEFYDYDFEYEKFTQNNS